MIRNQFLYYALNFAITASCFTGGCIAGYFTKHFNPYMYIIVGSSLLTAFAYSVVARLEVKAMNRRRDLLAEIESLMQLRLAIMKDINGLNDVR